MLFVSVAKIVNLNTFRAMPNPAITVMAGLVHLALGEVDRFSIAVYLIHDLGISFCRTTAFPPKTQKCTGSCFFSKGYYYYFFTALACVVAH